MTSNTHILIPTSQLGNSSRYSPVVCLFSDLEVDLPFCRFVAFCALGLMWATGMLTYVSSITKGNTVQNRKATVGQLSEAWTVLCYDMDALSGLRKYERNVLSHHIAPLI